MDDRAVVLARIADEFMGNGGQVPFPGYPGWPEGCTGIMASLWPEPPGEPYEVRFVAEWPGITVVCSRKLPAAKRYRRRDG